ncbi:MAG: VIT1/CCC1 transporter family protein, partial [Parachlamydiaceae bacterium]|nr:VIT1/CCC1 transporter family protein [Parachlamydiaceae bacterium]
AQAEGLLSAAEIHGTETPGRISAAADAARDTAIALTLAWGALATTETSISHRLILLTIIGISFILWKAGRSAWLGWSRLERLHRILAQEKWEIEHNRQQERDELRVLYNAKGFEGKLLEDVLDVLMADGNRLLKVMAEEELGLSLEAYDHPLTQSVGAAIGGTVSLLLCLLGAYLNVNWGIILAALGVIAGGASLSAYHADNRYIPAIIWNIGLAIITFGKLYFLIEFFFSK